MPQRPATDELGIGSLRPDDQPELHFADADWQRFCEQAAQLGVQPQHAEQRAIYERWYSHLQGVNRWMNLTRIADAADYLERHLLDSLTLLSCPYLQGLDRDAPCVDLGSGGGYPGLPLAQAMPDHSWVLVDSRRKKVDFLQAALALTANRRAEARQFRGREAGVMAPDLSRCCQRVVARAVGPVPRLLIDAAALLEEDGILVCPKGPAYERDELAETKRVCKELGFRMLPLQRIHGGEVFDGRVIACFAYQRAAD